MGPIIIIIICPSGESSPETPAQPHETNRIVAMRPSFGCGCEGGNVLFSVVFRKQKSRFVFAFGSF